MLGVCGACVLLAAVIMLAGFIDQTAHPADKSTVVDPLAAACPAFCNRLHAWRCFCADATVSSLSVTPARCGPNAEDLCPQVTAFLSTTDPATGLNANTTLINDDRFEAIWQQSAAHWTENDWTNAQHLAEKALGATDAIFYVALDHPTEWSAAFVTVDRSVPSSAISALVFMLIVLLAYFILSAYALVKACEYRKKFQSLRAEREAAIARGVPDQTVQV